MAESKHKATPFGNIIESVTIAHLQADLEPASITNSRYVASFNWLKSRKPSIVVPGVPPRWKPLDDAERLPEDSGKYYRDINAAHYPSHPIEPAVRALLMQQPGICFDEIDLFACGSTIGNLLRLALGTEKNFRFVVEIIGDTVFFVRRENSPTEQIEDVRGYGHTFPDRYTSWHADVRGSTSHQRMIRYDFAGFDCIVRYEGDGYLPFKDKSRPGNVYGGGLPDLEGLAIKLGGTVVPQEAMFDLKTRSARRTDDILAGEIGRLWARQISNFILAYHTRGVFQDIRVQDIRNDVQKWQSSHQKQLRLLAAIIAKIVSVMRNGQEDRLEVCCQERGIFELRRVGGTFPHALPEDLQRVWGTDASSSGSSTPSGVPLEPKAAQTDDSIDHENDSEDDSGEEDFTACSVVCGYCGQCKQ